MLFCGYGDFVLPTSHRGGFSKYGVGYLLHRTIRILRARMKFYAGIGSRSTPPEECAKLTRIASILEKRGYILRSGGAEGADKAFEKGVFSSAMKEIIRPNHSTPEAELIASQIHPAWHACNKYARQLHGRNVQLILGKHLIQPVEFVIAWTLAVDGGGTRTGLVLAKERDGIPTFNLARPEEARLFSEFMLGYKP